VLLSESFPNSANEPQFIDDHGLTMLAMDTKITTVTPMRPDILLRVEALGLLALNVVAYNRLFPHSWGIFALLFLVPDVGLLGYLLPQKRLAATLYNCFHTYVLPLALLAGSWPLGWALGGQIALIWTAHISFDRMVGYGLKFPESFKFTHIQRAAAIGSLAD